MADMGVFNIDPDLKSFLSNLNENNLLSFAKVREDSTNDKQVELYIYCCLLIFQTSHSEEQLEQAIQRANGWLAVTPADHSDHSRRSSILDTLSRQMHQYKSQQNIQKAAKTIPQLYPGVLGFHPRDIGVQMQPMVMQALIMAQSLTNRAVRLAQNYTETGRLADLDEAIAVMDRVVNIDDGLVIPPMLGNFASMLLQRFLGRGLIGDLNRAISNQSKALDAASPEDPEYFKFLLGLNSMLLLKCKEKSSTEEDLNRAIELSFKAMAASPHDPIDRSLCLNNLGSSLSDRFEKRGSLKDLDDAIKFTTEAVGLIPLDRPDYALYSSNLARLLGLRFDRTGVMEDNYRAIKAAVNSVQTTPQMHVDRPRRLRVLRQQLNAQFIRTSSVDVLNRMIGIATEVLDLTPSNHPDRATRLSDLGTDLRSRFKQTGLMEDLNRAIEISAESLNATPPGHPDRYKYLSDMSSQLHARFDRLGSIGDLDRAIEIETEAVDTMPRDDRNRFVDLHNLGSLLSTRYDYTGALEDLDRAIELASHAWRATPENVPNYYRMSNDLGIYLSRRFERTGSMEDIDDAVNALMATTNSMPQDHYEYASVLSNFATILSTRFESKGSMEDLDRAIEFATRAVNAVSRDHPSYAQCLDSLANRLCRRFKLKEMKLDPACAINLPPGLTAMALCLEGEVKQPKSTFAWEMVSNLERTSNFEHISSSETFKDLDRAIDLSDTAVRLIPQDHPDRGLYLQNYATRLSYRYEWTESPDDLDRKLETLVEGWRCDSSPPSVRINLARGAAQILALRGDWKESSQLLKGAISLLPTISPRYLSPADMQSLLADLSGLASTAAAVALNAGEEPREALRLLELGRGVISGLLMDMRGDISDLKLKYPKLADKFTLLRDELDSPVKNTAPFSPMNDDVSSWESKVKRRREATREFDEIVEEIRSQPEFRNFIQLPDTEDLMTAAGSGPIIVVNMSFYRSDAFLIKTDRIETIKLPHLAEPEVRRKVENLSPTSDLASLLEWLWQSVCCPCLDALGFKGPIIDNEWPHIWWVPTGLLSQLPLHAAGIYTGTSTDTVLDRVISSYASSIKALVHNRQQTPQHATEESQVDSAILVAMQNTPGLSGHRNLPFAAKEVEILGGLCPSLQLNAILPQRSKEGVLKHLQKCKLFHFAGHGSTDLKDPSNSYLLLEDWESNPLTVGNLRDSRLQENPPFLAYLSACSTGSNKVANLSDEGIHLVSAFQLAGFRHVVGTLWEVSDKHCVDVASVLYETLRDEGMTDIAVSRGLHFAIRALRDEGMRKGKETRDAKVLNLGASAARGAMDYFWVPYVHFGA